MLLPAWGLILRPDLLISWRADYAAPRAEMRAITLSDGTDVLLDAGSALDVVASEPERIVRLLQGQAYFNVTKTGRPFVVEAGDGRVRVLGTQFDVRLFGDSAEVTLQEGSVAVSGPGAGEQTLTPGERIRIEPDGPGAPEAVDLGDATAWRSGRYVFYHRPLGEVVEVLERHGRGRLMVVGADLAAKPVSGSILLNDSDDALQALAGISGFHVIQLPGSIKIISQ